MRTLWGDPLDLALTTNGHLLDSLAVPLKAAGLNRITVSMDAVDAPTFERITRIPGSFDTVLKGVRIARAAGLTPLKINSRTPVEVAVSAAEFLLEGMTAHKKISRSEARTFTAGEKRRRNEEAANLGERARERLQDRDLDDIARNRTRRGFN